MSPRLTDWTIALAVSIALATGIISLFSGHPEDAFIFVLHGVGGLWLLLLLWGKLRRVWPRLVFLRRWDRRTLFGLAALVFMLVTLGSGIWWAAGGDVVLAWFNLLGWHIALGFTLAGVVLFHLLARAKWLRKRDVVGRRRVLHFGALLLGGAALWPAQQLVEHVLHLPGAERRFTGSHESQSFAGNAFPTTSWVADQPRLIDAQTWRLTLTGAVKKPMSFTYDDLASAGDELEATLDCTSGFYSTQRWQGIRIGRLLDQAGLTPDARYVRFLSVTSYRWSLPVAEARLALLATQVGDETISHDHGFPARLVAPGRRGMEWVKWVVGIEVLTGPDPGQVLSIFTSSFTPAGKGE
ncbi:MAG TPA: molybdopterin-dependent oxidoreductase [Ktedonobacterales bacterium]|jgi:DMSO/TMAO reductase YedYZ molybdopterin-dependent catalytic subunit